MLRGLTDLLVSLQVIKNEKFINYEINNYKLRDKSAVNTPPVLHKGLQTWMTPDPDSESTDLIEPKSGSKTRAKCVTFKNNISPSIKSAKLLFQTL